MDEFQQIMSGGAGAAGFYLLYQGVNIVKGMIDKKPKNGAGACDQHGIVCAHLEAIKTDVNEIKGTVNQIVRDVSKLQGRLEER